MTDTEWARIVLMLRHGWARADAFTDAEAKGYRLFLGNLPAANVAAAIGRFAERGGTWRPTAAEILASVTGGDRQHYLDPATAWRLVERAISKVGCGVYDPKFTERHQAAVDWLRTQDEAVAAWAAQRGLCGRGSLGLEEVHGPYGGAVLKRLEGDYTTIRDRAVERLQLGQPAFPDRAFLVRGTGEGGGGLAELVERLRPVRELDAGPTDPTDPTDPSPREEAA